MSNIQYPGSTSSTYHRPPMQQQNQPMYQQPMPYPAPGGPPPYEQYQFGQPPQQQFQPYNGPPRPTFTQNNPNGQYHPPINTYSAPPIQLQNYPAPPMSSQQATRYPRKKALFIGINYTGQRSELRGMIVIHDELSGCQNDVRNIRDFISKAYNFPTDSDSMVSLTDDQRDPNFIPTRRNIINAMQWLVLGAIPGDTFFFHYSGHGSQVKDIDGDEDDGFDETICPVDYERAGMIVDDDMHAIMVRPLPQGSKFIGIFDSCHSGTALDLPYTYHPDGTLKKRGMMSSLGSTFKSAAPSMMRGGLLQTGMTMLSGLKTAMNSEGAQKQTEATRTTYCNAISLSGCKDNQTSADASFQGRAQGAMSHALIAALQQWPTPTYGQLLQSVRAILQRDYSQVPQMSSGHIINLNEIFYL